jgi:hypothetical protein
MDAYATRAAAEAVAQRLTATRVGGPAASRWSYFGANVATRVTRYVVERCSNGFYGIVEHWEYVDRPDFKPGRAFLDAD